MKSTMLPDPEGPRCESPEPVAGMPIVACGEGVFSSVGLGVGVSVGVADGVGVLVAVASGDSI
jgi:hypothetical protein